MKRIIDHLSSMYLTLAVLSVLILWFTWGILLAESQPYQHGFRIMNSMLAPEWFSQPGRLAPLLEVWFVGVCALMVILGINLIFCSWSKILKLMKNRYARAKFVMLIIHIVFGLVALGHFGSFILGYRYDNVRLQAGASFTLPHGDGVTVKRIHVIDDLAVLQTPRRERTPGSFHPRQNFCDVVLTHNGNAVASGKVYRLHPLTWKDIQVTLKRFTRPKGGKSRDPTPLKPGVNLIITRNPVKSSVFVLFPVMIAGIGAYMLMTWSNRRAENFSSLSKSKGGKEA